MIIDKNEKEKRALELYHQKEREKAMELEAEFVDDLRKAVADGMDHCSCKSVSCKYHGLCMECIAIHRAHEDHLPQCLQGMVNERLRVVSELTEHTFRKYRLDT